MLKILYNSIFAVQLSILRDKIAISAKEYKIKELKASEKDKKKFIYWDYFFDSSRKKLTHSIHLFLLFLFFVSSMFSISLCSLLGYHIHLVLNNRTTLEAFRFQIGQHFCLRRSISSENSWNCWQHAEHLCSAEARTRMALAWENEET